LQLKLGQIENEYQNRITKDRRQIITELTAFLRRFCEVIGQSQLVDPVVNSFQGEPIRLPETVTE
jgi:hypothetical protein